MLFERWMHRLVQSLHVCILFLFFLHHTFACLSMFCIRLVCESLQLCEHTGFYLALLLFHGRVWGTTGCGNVDPFKINILAVSTAPAQDETSLVS